MGKMLDIKICTIRGRKRNCNLLKHRNGVKPGKSADTTDKKRCSTMDTRAKQHTKSPNLPKVLTGIASSSPISREKSTQTQKR